MGRTTKLRHPLALAPVAEAAYARDLGFNPPQNLKLRPKGEQVASKGKLHQRLTMRQLEISL